jgi:hypothetical protein
LIADIENCPLIIPGQYPVASVEATGSDCRIAVALEAHELLSRWLPQVCIMLGAEFAGLMACVVDLAVADLHAMPRLADIRLRRIRLTGPDGASTTLLLPKRFMTYSAEAPGVTAAPYEVHGS